MKVYLDEGLKMSEEDRFVEIVSTQKIKDNHTGIEYNGLIDGRLLEKINELEGFRNHYKKQKMKLVKENELLWDVVDGFLALEELRCKGYL